MQRRAVVMRSGHWTAAINKPIMRVTQNATMHCATVVHALDAGLLGWRTASITKPICMWTETPGARCTTLVSVAELAPLVVVVPALLASPSVAFALRPIAISPALEVVVAADSTEPIAFLPPMSQFPSFAASLFREPVTGWGPPAVKTNQCVNHILEAESWISGSWISQSKL